MKAIVYQGVRDVGVREVADPRIENADDIIVKVTSTAICGSDLHLIHGRVKGMYDGYVLGHETMGIVEKTGRGVAAVKKGDRVVVPFPVACGHCAFCEAGEYSQCDNSNPNGEAGGLFGYSESYGDYAGGQAQYLRVPYANVGPVKVPEELTDEQALFCTDILPTSRWGADIGGVKEGHGGGARVRAGGPLDHQMGAVSGCEAGNRGGSRGLPPQARGGLRCGDAQL